MSDSIRPSKTIDPDSHILGLPLGSNPDELASLYGSPQGVFKISNKLTAYIYSPNWIFIFSNNSLCGAGFSISGPLHYRLNRLIVPQQDSTKRNKLLVNWKFSNGITQQMKRSDVRKNIQPIDLERVDDFVSQYHTEKTLVKLHFIGSPPEENQRLFDFLILTKEVVE